MLWQRCVSQQKWELAARQGVKSGKNTKYKTTVFAKKRYPIYLCSEEKNKNKNPNYL